MRLFVSQGPSNYPHETGEDGGGGSSGLSGCGVLIAVFAVIFVAWMFLVIRTGTRDRND